LPCFCMVSLVCSWPVNAYIWTVVPVSGTSVACAIIMP